VKHTKSIAFGFYNGLGDVISDKPVVEHFLDDGYDVEIYVYAWLVEFTEFLFPQASVKGIKDTKSIKNIEIKSDNFFLTPNYLHKFSFSKSSFFSYLLKSFILKSKVKKLIAVDVLTILQFAFDVKKTYLDKHFFDRSFSLITKSFKLEYPSFNSSFSKPKKMFVFPFSGRDSKDYPQSKFLKVLNSIKGVDITVFVQEKDLGRVDRGFFEYELKSLSLKEITLMMDRETLVFANDSGTAHLGAMRGCSVVALYGETNPKIYKPRGAGVIKTLNSLDKNVANIDENMILSVINSLLS